MIAASVPSAALAARLTAKARLLAGTHLSTRHDDPRRWRRAGWLWPLIAKD